MMSLSEEDDRFKLPPGAEDGVDGDDHDDLDEVDGEAVKGEAGAKRVLDARELSEFEKKERRKGIVRLHTRLIFVLVSVFSRRMRRYCGLFSPRYACGSTCSWFHWCPRPVHGCLLSLPVMSAQIHLTRIPPYMKPVKIRQLLSVYGELGRIYLKPEGLA